MDYIALWTQVMQFLVLNCTFLVSNCILQLVGSWSQLLSYTRSAIDDMPEELDQDLESFIQPVEDEDSDPAFRNRRVLRSGQVYLNIPRSNPRSILKPAHLVSSCANDSEALQSPSDINLLKLAEQSNSVETFPLPGHGNDLVTQPEQSIKSISWNPSLSVRFLSGNDPLDYTQDLLVHTEQSCVLPAKTALMLSAFSLDMSQAELCYIHRWSTPAPTNDLLVLE